MTAKVKRILLCALILLCGICALTACGFGTTVNKEKDKYGLTALVTYHANGGKFSNGDDFANIYYKDGSRPLNVGGVLLKSGSISVTYTGHTFAGWYYAETDEEGNILYEDEENGIVALGEEVDFSATLKSGDEWHVYADWTLDQKLEVVLASEESIEDSLTYTYKEGDEQKEIVYSAGDVVREYSFTSGGTVSKPSRDVITDGRKAADGYVFVDFYYDEACTQPVVWPVTQNDEIEENVRIYAKYLTDDWTVVDGVTEVQSMFSYAEDSHKYYISKDIDCSSSLALALPVDRVFSGQIRGNGFTISGLKVQRTQMENNTFVSLFGTLASGAKITDLVLENVQLEVTGKTNASLNVYFLSPQIESGAEISGLTIMGGKVTVRVYGSALNGVSPDSISECPLLAGNAEDYGITVEEMPTITIK